MTNSFDINSLSLTIHINELKAISLELKNQVLPHERLKKP
jgi:hypothetical protein